MHPLVLALALTLSAPDLTPFLVGSSHPEIARPDPTPTELSGLKRRIYALLQHPRAPGVQSVKDFADELVEDVRKKELGYIDAAWIVLRVRDTLATHGLGEKVIHDMAKDISGRLADTPCSHKVEKQIVRGAREVASSARWELP